MQITPRQWSDNQGNAHSVFEVKFEASDITKARAIAHSKIAYVNVHNPGGIRRTLDVINNRIIAGKLADFAVLQAIRDSIRLRKIEDRFHVSEYDAGRSDGFQQPDPYDLALADSTKASVQTIEVRSSFCYRIGRAQNIVNRLSIYGWYTSFNKIIEPPKDWYWQVIFHSRPKDIPEPSVEGRPPIVVPIFEETLTNNSTVGFIVGGSTREFLEKQGIARNDQDNAIYQSIFPISTGFDAEEMLVKMTS